MRLNLGCGEFPAPGWVNVDIWPGVNPDVVASILDLPFPDGCAEQVYAGHVLEHLDHPAGVRAALAEVHRALAPGGRAVFVTPDCERSVHLPEHHGAVHGGHRWPGDEHRWEATEEKLLTAVRQVFPEAQPIAPRDTAVQLANWPVVAHVTWQCAVIAHKPKE